VDPPKRTLIALYSDAGTSSSIEKVKKALANFPDLEVKPVTAEEIRNGALKGADVLLHSGGSGGGQGKALGEKGRSAERDFIAAGGGYVGICAGAYLATCAYDWSLHILDAKVIDRQHWARGTGTVEIALSAEGRKLLGTATPAQAIEYRQGPLLAPAEDPEVPDFTSLATYATEIAKKGAPSGVMVGTTAVASGAFQKGRVIVFSPHPEMTEALWRQLHRAVLWAANRLPNRD
jgi:glutamine amidotransferase-like uncharacterized protein